MSSKVHVSQDGKIRRCSAQSPASCTAKGIITDKAEHFESVAQAKKYVETLYEKKLGAFNTFDSSLITKNTNAKQNDIRSLNEKIDDMDYNEIAEFSNSNINNYNSLNSLIDYRNDEIFNKFNNLESCNPANNDSKSVSNKVFKEMKRDLQEYKDTTAELVEIQTQSKFFKPKYIDKELDRVGNATLVGRLEPGSEELAYAKFNTLDGNDISVLAQKDFGQPTLLNTIQYKGLEKVKTSANNISSVLPSSTTKSGALYRDNAWKKRLKDDYARDNKDIVLITTDSYYKSSDNDWQQVNFDGIVVNTKNREPEGIVEIKTNANKSQWGDGVPVGAKAEALYYLNTTDLDYVDFIVQTTDGKTELFRVAKDETLNGDVKIDSYLKANVEPWFENIKNNRN